MTQSQHGHVDTAAATGNVGSGDSFDEMKEIVRVNTHVVGCTHQFHWRMAPICLCRISHRERYRIYLQTDEWYAVRDAVMESNDFKCADCKADATEVHHLNYDRVFRELPEDLIPLCRWCHRVRHDRVYIDLEDTLRRALTGTGSRYSRKELIK